jgi:hypothetical protein
MGVWRDIRKALLGLIFLLRPICQLQSHDCYSEYWQKLFWKMWENKSFILGTYIKIDTGNGFKSIRSLQFNEQFIWKASNNFFFEIHYAYIHGRLIVPNSPWRWQHRLELEANPIFQLPWNCLVKTRNRLEIRRVQTEPKILYRLRQRTMLVIPFEKEGVLKSYSVYNELFYNVSTHLFTQDRICPCQLTFAISDEIDLDVFFLVRFFTANHIWGKSVVLGTQFNF